MIETGTPGRWPRRCGKHLWADVLAQRFETGQWCNRFTMGAIQWWQAWAPLTTSRDVITVEEVIAAAKTLKSQKATGEDSMPAEFWETICAQDSLSSRWAHCLCNKVWCNGHVPGEWHEAVASAMCKKETWHLVKAIALSHYWQSATICLLQFCCPDWRLQALTQ